MFSAENFAKRSFAATKIPDDWPLHYGAVKELIKECIKRLLKKIKIIIPKPEVCFELL